MPNKLSRRAFLKLTGTGLAAAAGGAALAGCGPAATPVPPTTAPAAAPTTAAAAAPTTAAVAAPTVASTAAPAAAAGGKAMKVWWWGEQEAPGLEKWLNSTIDLWKKQSGATVETHLQDTTTTISEFQTAAAAHNGPDVQYVWNGIYHMESVWLNYLQPLNGLIDDKILKDSNATVLSIFEGKQYRTGWYAASPLYLYNKELFTQAGLDPEKPPTTWEDLQAACDKLKAKNITPITAGLKDGPWGEWFMGHGLGPNLDSPGEACNLFAGELDWRDAKYWEHWDKLAKMWKAGYFNNDMNSIDLYPGIDLFGNGKGAMTAVVAPLVAKVAKQLGPEKVGLMVFPIGGKGKMNGRPIKDAQGWAIATDAKDPKLAADFLTFMQTSDRVTSLYKEVNVLPTTTSFDGNTITDPVLKKLWEGWVADPQAVPYISNLMPTLFWTDAMFVNSQKIIAGEMDGKQAGDNAQTVAQKWREQNPDLLAKYKIWANDLKL